MVKDLAVNDKTVDQLVALGFTGHDIGAGNVYPSSVNILQSDKQYEAFEDGEEITKKMYGKLFVRKSVNKISDLVDKIEGTIIKIERGYEIRDSENKVMESGYGFLDAIEKDKYVLDGFKPINMVKVLLALGDSRETEGKMELLNNKIADGEVVTNEDYPFSLVVVKGSSFGNWFNVEKMMQDLANEHFHRSLSQIPVIAFRLAVTSKKEEGTDYTYYSMDFNILPNEAQEALAFAPYLMEAKEQHLFYKVKEKIEMPELVKNEEVKGALEFSKEVLADDTSEEISDDDLPF